MEAVKIVAEALNEIFDKDPLIMKRQIKSGVEAGSKVEGKIDLTQLPSPKIVMINCSFDSVCQRACSWLCVAVVCVGRRIGLGRGLIFVVLDDDGDFEDDDDEESKEDEVAGG